MTDRELLEKAAIVAGVPLDLTLRPDRRPLGCNERGLAIAVEPGWWNPLTDDGDALRLAGKLRIQIEHMKTLKGDDFGVNCWPSGRGDCGVSEDGDLSDYMAAMRRAIVRAAARLADAPGAA